MKLPLCLLAAFWAANPFLLASPIRVEVDTGNPIHVLAPGKESGLALVFSNPNQQAVTLGYTVHFQSYNGAAFDQHDKLTVPANGSSNQPIRQALPDLGLWYVDYHLEPDGMARQDGRLTFAYMTPAGRRRTPPNGIIFGNGGGDLSGPGLENDALAAELCGTDILRCDLQFDAVEPRKGIWNEDLLKKFSRGVDLLQDHGVAVEFLLCYNARWNSTPALSQAADRREWLFSPPTDLEEWRKYVAKVATRYGDRVKLWEVWNETDIIQFWTGTADQYLALLKVSYEAIKAVDPKLQVMTSGFATLLPHGGRKDPDFMAKVVKQGTGDFDILAHHQHGSFDQFVQAVDGPLQKIRDTVPGKPLYFNETSANRDLGDATPAELLWKKAIFAWSKGAMGYNWFCLRSGALDVRKTRFNWGIITDDFYPTPTFVSYNTLTTYLRDKRIVGRLDLGGQDYYGYRFEGDGATALVSWSTDNAPQRTATVVQAPGVRHAYTVDLMGNKQVAALEGDRVLLTTGPTPAMLILEGDRLNPALGGSLVSIEAPAHSFPGDTVPLGIVLHNPFPEKREFHVALHFPSIPDQKEQVVEVAAGGSQRVAAAVALPVGLTTHDDRTLDGQVSYTVANTAWRGSLPAKVGLGVNIPESSFGQRPADFDLSRYSEVVNLNENVPQREHLTWKGPADLSAKVWLHSTGQFLQVRAEVADDVAHFVPPGGDPLEGDSLQLAFLLPGQDGTWEFTVIPQANGGSQMTCGNPPRGFKEPAASTVESKVTRQGTTYLYEVQIPWAALTKDGKCPASMHFNLAAIDNDNDGLKGWIQLATGLGGKKAPYPSQMELSPLVRFSPH